VACNDHAGEMACFPALIVRMHETYTMSSNSFRALARQKLGPMTTLGQVIRLRRSELGLTQEELAERVGGGVRQAEISRLERDGVNLPRRQRLEQLAQALDMPLGALLARSGWSGAELEFPPAAPEPAEPEPGIAILQHEPERDEPRAATKNMDVPHLHDAISRAEVVMNHTESVIQKARITYDRAQQSVDERRRRNDTLDTKTKA